MMLNYKRIRVPLHIVFWLFVLAFYTLLFGFESRNYAMAFRFVLVLLPITVITTYFLNYYLIPRFLLPKKYLRFSLFFLYTLIISITLELNAVMITLVGVADYRMDRMVTTSFNLFYLIAANYLVVFLAAALKLLNHWFSMQKKNLLLEKESMEIELKLKEAELKLLRAQIHPHFLFNTLNNLYGLALSGSKQTPDIVLKISSLLDYMLYRSTKPYVDLDEELRFIRDYIELEKLRYKNLDLSFKKEGDTINQKIAPLLLQPFVENAFKHGVSREMKNPMIRIQMSVKDSLLDFTVENSKNEEKQTDTSGYTEGIGLKNVKKRLQILYPQRHQLEITENENLFTIHLNLELILHTDENKMSAGRR